MEPGSQEVKLPRRRTVAQLLASLRVMRPSGTWNALRSPHALNAFVDDDRKRDPVWEFLFHVPGVKPAMVAWNLEDSALFVHCTSSLQRPRPGFARQQVKRAYQSSCGLPVR